MQHNNKSLKKQIADLKRDLQVSETGRLEAVRQLDARIVTHREAIKSRDEALKLKDDAMAIVSTLLKTLSKLVNS